MASNGLPTNGIDSEMKDPTHMIPGITVVEKINVQNDVYEPNGPESCPGPDIDGRPTVLTKFTPPQLAASSLVNPLNNMLNLSFLEGHKYGKQQLVDVNRIHYENQMFDELGTAPGTATWILCYKGTEDVIATASTKRYLGKIHIVEKSAQKNSMFGNTWTRFGFLDPGTAAWELSTMAVIPTLTKRGLAGYLMKIVEDDVKRMFAELIEGPDGAEKPSRLVIMLTTCGEANGDFYKRRSFEYDYGTYHPPGFLGSTCGFSVVHMSKVIRPEDLKI